MTTERSRTRFRRTFKVASWLWFGLLVSACAGGAGKAINSDLEAEIPANLRADYVSFTQNCAKCHGLERALNAHVMDVRHWDLYVAKMMRTAGSAISASEAPKILRFLYWYTERENSRADDRSKAAKRTLPPLTDDQAKQPVPPSGGAETAPSVSQPPPVPPAGPDVGSSNVTTPRSPESIQGETAP
jgi:hypothetical protein